MQFWSYSMNDAQILLLLETEYKFYEYQVGVKELHAILTRASIPPLGDRPSKASLNKANSAIRIHLRTSKP